MDWDRLRIFQASASAGSFTHAGDVLGLSQSAVSRQVSALESELKTPLFHRHARGLILTEQGELLLRTVNDVMLRLETARSRLTDSREKPKGELKITTSIDIGTNWLAPLLAEFLEQYPDIKIQMILDDEELDLGMREADLALRMREPVQPDLIRRRLFTIRCHAYGAKSYLDKHGAIKEPDDLDNHAILGFASFGQNFFLNHLNALLTLGRDAKNPRAPALLMNNIGAALRAVENGVGLAVLPDYRAAKAREMVRILPDADMPELDCFLTYPEEMRNVARLEAIRDFLFVKAKNWGIT